MASLARPTEWPVRHTGLPARRGDDAWLGSGASSRGHSLGPSSPSAFWGPSRLLLRDPRKEPDLGIGLGPSSGVAGVGSGPPRQREPRGRVPGEAAPRDRLVYHSWIIGAAVVNAFYSPNRNQIGKFLPFPACPSLLVPELKGQLAAPCPSLSPGGTPACSRNALLHHPLLAPWGTFAPMPIGAQGGTWQAAWSLSCGQNRMVGGGRTEVLGLPGMSPPSL